MSFSRVLIDSNGRRFTADSFDRFGDDLCELLLSYLCFEDKFRFECVSKQWKRLVFNKVVDIGDLLFWPNEEQMKTLLQKCPNLKTMNLFFDQRMVSLLPLLSDNCHRLKSMQLIVSGEVSPETTTAFGQILGSKVETIYLKDFSNKEDLLYWCPNLKRLFCRCNLWLQLVDNQLVPTLNSLGEVYIVWEQMSAFVQLVDKYEKTLKNISVHFSAADNIDLIIEQLSRLKCLQTIALNIIGDNSGLDLTPKIIDLGQCCPNLTIIHLDCYEAVLSRPLGPVMNTKRLTIKCCIISEDFFDNLSELFPNVKEFKFISQIIHSNKHLNSLSRMKFLNKLVLKPFNHSIIHPIDDSAVIQLFDNCKELKELKLKFHSNITLKTIDRVKELADNRPKERTSFKTTSSVIKTEDLTAIPPNLLIEISKPYFKDDSSTDSSEPDYWSASDE